MGDSRGHWEGNTLVVETTNLKDQPGVGGGLFTDAAVLTERFTRISPNELSYDLTVNDPKTWTKPWTLHMPYKLDPSYKIYEYACHEGNYMMLDALTGARDLEKKGQSTKVDTANQVESALPQLGAAWSWLAVASGFAQQPQLAKDPGPFLPGFGVEQDKGPKPVAGPAPHLPDGRPDFGGNGAWYPGFNGNIAETKWKGVKSADKHVDVPFLPWTLKTYNERVEKSIEGRSGSEVLAGGRAALHVRSVSVSDDSDAQSGGVRLRRRQLSVAHRDHRSEGNAS